MMPMSVGTGVLLAAVSIASSASSASHQSRDVASAVTMGTAEISGTLVSDDVIAAPVRRAIITLTTDGAGGTGVIAVTDDNGRFAFTSVPAGRYSLVATKGGYVPSSYGARRLGGEGMPIALSDGQRSSVLMKILKGSVLAGTVIDENGLPAPNAAVAALRYVWSPVNGERKLTPLPSQLTDDRGMYRIYGLEPGEYLVSATSSMTTRLGFDDLDIRPITESDVRRAQDLLRTSGGISATAPTQAAGTKPLSSTINWAPVYYPGVTVASDAAPIALGPHEERAGINVQLRMVATARVDGVTLGRDGAPVPNVPITMFDPGPLPEGYISASLRNARSDKDGKFVMTGINPGHYTMMAYGSGEQRLTGVTEVSIDGRDVAVSIVMAPSVPVSGRIVFEGASARPNPRTLTPSLWGSLMGGYGLRVEDDGAFAFLSVSPGRYRIRINTGAPGGWGLRSVTLNGADIFDVAFEVKSERIDGVVITFTDQRTEISGTLQDAAGKAAPDYVLLIFPADKHFWTPQNRRTQQVRPDADGRFIVRDLPAGDYLISALTDVEPGRWNDPKFLAELAAQSPIKITLADGEKKVQHIRVGGG